MENQVKEQLNLLMDSIRRSDGPAMAASMERLDALLAEGRDTLPPRLAHFLEKRSYAKALQLLDGAATGPAGTCGPRRGTGP